MGMLTPRHPVLSFLAPPNYDIREARVFHFGPTFIGFSGSSHSNTTATSCRGLERRQQRQLLG